MKWPREDCEELRLDNMVAIALGISRSKANKLIENGAVLVDGQVEQSKKKLVSTFSEVILTEEQGTTSLSENTAMESINEPEPQPMELDIRYEDEDVIVVNKPKGLLVHPSLQQLDTTLVNGLLNHCKLAAGSGPWRPGILHRLDRDTSGLVVAAKNQKAYDSLRIQFDQRKVEKIYFALCKGHLQEPEGMVEAPIGRPIGGGYRRMVNQQSGKYAKTCYKVLKELDSYQLVMLKLITGRTHQIRVHMSHLGHPLLGDWLYGNSKFKKEKDGTMYEVINNIKIKGQMLHSGYIAFNHPSTNQLVEVTSLPEDDFLKLCKLEDESMLLTQKPNMFTKTLV